MTPEERLLHDIFANHDCADDATRCQTCHDAEAVYQCEVCSDVFEPSEGCLCDGHYRCASCLIWCPECTANMRDDMATEGIER